MGAPTWPPPRRSERPGGTRAESSIRSLLDPPALAAAAGRARGGGGRVVGVDDGAEAGDLPEPGLLQRAVHAVANPLAVPPLERRHRDAGHQHLEVQVIADGEAGGARAAQWLSLGDLVT